MDLNARVDVNCGRQDGWTENQTPMSHLAKAGVLKSFHLCYIILRIQKLVGKSAPSSGSTLFTN